MSTQVKGHVVKVQGMPERAIRQGREGGRCVKRCAQDGGFLMTTGVFDKCGNDLAAASPCPASVTPMVSRRARFAWVTALTGSCSYVVSAIRCASCSVITMGRSSQGYAAV